VVPVVQEKEKEGISRRAKASFRILLMLYDQPGARGNSFQAVQIALKQKDKFCVAGKSSSMNG